MKIELKNIGTVKHAEIDLDKDLLIFCGPNNSGKTYVAYALYGVYKTAKYGLSTIIGSEMKYDNDGYLRFTLSPHFVREILAERGETVCTDLGNVFASHPTLFSNSKISIDSELKDEEIDEKIKNLVIENESISGLGGQYEINKSKDSLLVSVRNKNAFIDNQDKKRSKSEKDYDITIIVKRLVTNLIFGNSFIAPAERIAINVFSKEVFLNRSGLLDNPFKDASNTKSRYSLPIAVSLQVAEDLSFLEKTQSKYAAIAEQIESKILLGSISVSPNGEMLFNPKNANIKGLGINVSGSMVKSLASIVFYFRHLAQEGDFIIIDEPELNLHPDNQIIMARILARIVNEEFKVLISTHSDYIITEINNLIRLNSGGENSKSLMEKYGYESADLINKDHVGVYMFKDHQAESLPVDEFGFEISTIQKENSRLAQVSESIYFDLFDKED